MFYYTFRALTLEGRIRHGFLRAPSRHKARDLILRRPLTLLSLWRLSPFLMSYRLKRHREHISLSLFHFTEAGLSLLIAFETLESMHQGLIQHVLSDIRCHLTEGVHLSQSLENHPWLLNRQSAVFIRMGERTGDMKTAFQHIQSDLTNISLLQNKVRQAVRYPLLLLGIWVMTSVVLFQSLVPILEDLSRTFGQDCPPATRSLLWVAACVQNGGGLFILGVFGFISGLWGISRFYKPLRYFFEGFQWRVPLLGPLRLSVAWSRFFFLWGMLLQQGVPLLDGIREATHVLPWVFLRLHLEKVQKNLREGDRLSPSFRKTVGLMPATFQLLDLAERTGQLPTLLMHISTLYRQDSDRLQERLLTFLQPVCLILLGGFMIWLISGTFLALYTTGLHNWETRG